MSAVTILIIYYYSYSSKHLLCLSSGSLSLTLNWDLDVFGRDLAGLLPGVNLNEGF